MKDHRNDVDKAWFPHFAQLEADLKNFSTDIIGPMNAGSAIRLIALKIMELQDRIALLEANQP